ncbi:MAG: hypothetical protein GY719_04895 [bacterium]|nr:hypothetical protein [bacterium]
MRLVIDGGVGIVQAAKGLSIHPDMRQRWRKQLEKDPGFTHDSDGALTDHWVLPWALPCWPDRRGSPCRPSRQSVEAASPRVRTRRSRGRRPGSHRGRRKSTTSPQRTRPPPSGARVRMSWARIRGAMLAPVTGISTEVARATAARAARRAPRPHSSSC